MPLTLEAHITKSKGKDDQYRIRLVAPEGKEPVAGNFTYRLDTLSVLMELEGFEPSARNAHERIQRIQAFGKELFQQVFTSKLSDHYKDLSNSADWLRLVIRIDKAASALEQLPWEFLYDGEGFISAGAKTSLIRYPLDLKIKDSLPPIKGRPRILCLISSPLDLADHERLQVELEKERLLQALDRSIGVDQIDVEFEDEATLANLEAALDEGEYHVLHYTGHGHFDPTTGGSLLLEDESGDKLPVGYEKLKFVLEKGLAKGLRLVFLSGCQTAKTMGREAFSDLARPLLHLGIPSVIAMQYSITDVAGILLAETFYKSLARGEEIDRALSETRRQVFLNDNLVVQGDFATPVLFAASPQSFVSVSEAMPTAEPTPKEICLDLAYQVPLQQLGAAFVGRRGELRQIKKAFTQENRRAVILHGIGGIGKTVTATQAALRLRRQFQGVYAFDCTEGALTPEAILQQLHVFLSSNNQRVLEEFIYQPLPNPTKATYLSQVLQQYPLLLIFDNMESLLDEEAKGRIADEDLRKFFKILLNNTATGTRFLFTSRYTFKITDGRLGQAFLAINLGDLSLPEALQIMNRLPALKKIHYEQKQKVFDRLGGHPYALNILDRHCADRPIETVLADLGEVNQELARFAALEISYYKLSVRAKDLLHRVSVFQKALPYEAIEWVMGEPDKAAWKKALATAFKQVRADEKHKDLGDEEIKKALERQIPEIRTAPSLKTELAEVIHWGLAVRLPEQEEEWYQVHSLVKDFCQGKLDEEERKKHLKDAARFYLNEARRYPQESPQSAFTKLDGRHLLFEAGEYEEAGHLVGDILNFFWRWGFIYLSERLLRETAESREGHGKAIALGNLATLHQMRGEYDKAIKIHQEVGKIFEGLGDKRNVANSLHEIGNTYFLRGEYTKAMEHLRKSLKISEALGDKSGIATSLYQIGVIYRQQGEYTNAMKLFHKSLKISEALGKREGIATSLHQIGMIYQYQGEPTKALEHYHKSLKIKEALGDKAGIATSFGQIGIIYHQLREYIMALEHYHKSLEIAEALGNKSGIAKSLHQIGMIYRDQGEPTKALEHYHKSLKIKETLGDKSGIATSLHQIGMIYQDQGEPTKALEHFHKSVEIAEALGNRKGIADSLHQIGQVLHEQKEFPEAFNHYLRALDVFTDLGSPDVQKAAINLLRLRKDWKAKAFDKAWEEATGQALPDWLKQRTSKKKASKGEQ